MDADQPTGTRKNTPPARRAPVLAFRSPRRICMAVAGGYRVYLGGLLDLGNGLFQALAGKIRFGSAGTTWKIRRNEWKWAKAAPDDKDGTVTCCREQVRPIRPGRATVAWTALPFKLDSPLWSRCRSSGGLRLKTGSPFALSAKHRISLCFDQRCRFLCFPFSVAVETKMGVNAA